MSGIDEMTAPSPPTAFGDGRVLGKAMTGLGIAVAYLLTARAGLLLDPVGGFAAAVWAPTGIALAGVLLAGRVAAPAIFAGALAANLLSGAPVVGAAAIAIGNTVEAVAGAWALRRRRG